jgi:hypothetical protein
MMRDSDVKLGRAGGHQRAVGLRYSDGGSWDGRYPHFHCSKSFSLFFPGPGPGRILSFKFKLLAFLIRFQRSVLVITCHCLTTSHTGPGPLHLTTAGFRPVRRPEGQIHNAQAPSLCGPAGTGWAVTVTVPGH